MNTIKIHGKLINLQQIHFVRKESDRVLIVSFGTDFIRFTGDCSEIDHIYDRLQKALE